MRVERTPEGLIVDVDDEAETEAFGLALAEVVVPGTVIGLVGKVGAGKTRLARAVAEALGADPAAIGSPTYVLIHEYEARPPIFHFDAYRLDGPDDFDALGAGEYLGGDGLCLVEWADFVADRLPASAWWLRIESPSPATRRFLLEAPAEVAALLADRLAGFSPGVS